MRPSCPSWLTKRLPSLYENYAAYVIDVLNNELIPSIVALNWGEASELPFLEVELGRPGKDMANAQRDKLLFVDMGLPVAKQWLYDRHKVPDPGPDEDLFEPKKGGNPDKPSTDSTPGSAGGPPASAKPCACCQPSEGEASSLGFGHWSLGFGEARRSMHGRVYGDGWTDPPPAHHNCRSRIKRVPKKKS